MTWVGQVSKVLVLIVVVGLGAWATVANLIGGNTDTVSSFVRDYATEYPLLLIALGALLGHWFAPMRGERRKTF